LPATRKNSSELFGETTSIQSPLTDLTQHKCPERSLRVLILGDGETVNEEGEIMSLESEEEEQPEAECKLIGVLGKMGECNTMKIEGK
jgi:hypothetical protein